MLLGPERSVEHEFVFEAPWEKEVTKHDLDKAMRTYLDRKEQEDGWRFIREISRAKTPHMIEGRSGYEAQEWVFKVILARPQRVLSLEIPDGALPYLADTRLNRKGRVRLA